jgi:uncharacterized membrane-anchored protein
MVARLQETYRTLAVLGADTAMTITASVRTVAEARSLLRQVRQTGDGAS